MKIYDNLAGGSRVRMARMDAYVKRWNSDAGHVKRDTLIRAEPGRPTHMQARGHGEGTISVDAHGPTFSTKPTAHANIPTSVLDGLRDCGESHDIVRSLPMGWYRDREFQDDTYSGHVWQLPARKGATIYLAGIVDKDAGYCMLDVSRGRIATFDDKDDAARAADELARILADSECDYQEQWREASRLDDKISEARDALGENRSSVSEAIAALRETCNAPHARKLALSAFHSAHASFKRALRDLASATHERAYFGDIT